MLGRAIGMHWLALVRDVLASGFRAADILTTLTVVEMVALVVGAPPGSSVRDAMEGGWSRTDHLLANMQEGSAGLASLQKPYMRPGVDERPAWESDDKRMFAGKAQEMTWDEAVERDKQRYALAAQAAERGIKPRNTRVRTI